MTYSVQLRNTWSRLQDDLSKEIFRRRLDMMLDGDPAHIDDIVFASIRHWENEGAAQKFLSAKSLLAFFKDWAGRGHEAVIFGAGAFGRQILKILVKSGFRAPCFCDNDPHKQGEEISSIPVLPPDGLSAYIHLPFIIAINDEAAVKLTYDQLLGIGVKTQNIYRIPSFANREYFDASLIGSRENEIYIDAGAYDGKTIEQFVNFCNGNYKAIYALEPDPVCYERTVGDVEKAGFQNTKVLNKGVWSSSRNLHFSPRLSGASGVDEHGDICVSMIAIDDMGIEPTLIKMDVEGSELQALMGARNTITAQKPRLAICLYHRPEDILDIPVYLLGLVPEYRFFVRHHSFCELDTVLYASV